MDTNRTRFITTQCCDACEEEVTCKSWNWECLSPGCNGTVALAAPPGAFQPGACSLRSDTGTIKTGGAHAHVDCISALATKPPTPAPAPVPRNARNVLYILVDDLRTQFNETYGHAEMVTPNIDAFAKESLVFEQAHVNSQMCVPTRNSFMTGRRPEATRVFNDGIGEHDFRVTGPAWTTHPGYFKENGYFTTGVGKTFHPGSPPNFDQCCSWSDVETLPYYYPAAVSCPTKSDVWCRIDDANATFEDTLILNEAVRRLEIAAKDPVRPFFLNVGFHKPHTPYRAPGAFYDLYPDAGDIEVAKYRNFPVAKDELGKTTGLAWFKCKAENNQYPINHSMPYPMRVQQELRKAYYASVSFTDHNIGQLLAAVDGMSFKFGKPIVVLHADHGYQLGERNIYCKETNYNLATHVPLIVHVPPTHTLHATSRGARTNALVEIVDVMPTVIALAGLPPFDGAARGEAPLGGRSFAALLAAPASASVARAARAALALSAGATLSAGDFNASYSQYGRKRCDDNLFATTQHCPNAHHQFMGVSVRTQAFRLTEWWVCDNVTGVPIWSTPGGATGVELYDHAADAAARTDDFDSNAEMFNVVGIAKYALVEAQLHALLRDHF